MYSLMINGIRTMVHVDAKLRTAILLKNTN